MAITEAALDGRPVGVIQDNGLHEVLIKKPGRYVLRVADSSLRALGATADPPTLVFDVPTTGTDVLVQLPAITLLAVRPQSGTVRNPDTDPKP